MKAKKKKKRQVRLLRDSKLLINPVATMAATYMEDIARQIPRRLLLFDGSVGVTLFISRRHLYFKKKTFLAEDISCRERNLTGKSSLLVKKKRKKKKTGVG